METRGKTAIRSRYSEEELELIRQKLDDEKTQLKTQADALQQQREEFKRDQETALRDINKLRDELEAGKRLRTTSEPDVERSSAETDLIRENAKLRREIEHFKAGPSPQPQTLSFPHPCDNNGHFAYGPDYGNDAIPRVSFREALESVPHFDGQNIPLGRFIRACRRAKEVVPTASEKNLTRLLINKLRDRAYYAIEDEPCDTVTQLTDLLNEAFGSPKTIDQYRGELSTVHLKPNEHILDYIIRVKDLRSSILDTERRTHGDLTPPTMANIDALTARSFCEGLPLNYRLQINPEHYTKPFEAFSHVKALAKRAELDRERFESSRRSERSFDKPSLQLVGRPIAHSTPVRSDNRRQVDSPPRADYGPRRDYNNTLRNTQPAENSWRNSPRDGINRDAGTLSNKPPRAHWESDAGSPRQKWCRYCKNAGHEIEECRKRAYNNTRRDQGNESRPSRSTDEPRAGAPQEPRPIRVIDEEPLPSTSSQS